MKKINLAEFKSAKRAAGAIEITGENGKTWTIDPPELWPDEAQPVAASGDYVGLAKLVLGGDDEYAAFVAAGGTAAMVGMMIADEHGATPGE